MTIMLCTLGRPYPLNPILLTFCHFLRQKSDDIDFMRVKWEGLGETNIVIGQPIKLKTIILFLFLL